MRIAGNSQTVRPYLIFYSLPLPSSPPAATGKKPKILKLDPPGWLFCPVLPLYIYKDDVRLYLLFIVLAVLIACAWLTFREREATLSSVPPISAVATAHRDVAAFCDSAHYHLWRLRFYHHDRLQRTDTFEGPLYVLPGAGGKGHILLWLARNTLFLDSGEIRASYSRHEVLHHGTRPR